MSDDEHAAGDTWTVAVTIPMSLPDELKDSLFRAISDSAYAWEPADRDGWDIDVVGAPIEQALARAEQAKAEADRWRRRAEAAEARLAALMDEQTAEQIARIQAERDALPEEERLRLEAADAPFLRIQVAGLTRKVAEARAEAERASELAARQIWDQLNDKMRLHWAERAERAEAAVERVRKLALAAQDRAALVRADEILDALNLSVSSEEDQ